MERKRADGTGSNGREGTISGELAALVLLSLGGLLLHVSIHPAPAYASAGNNADLIPFILGIAGVIVVPLLLSRERTWLTGYLINGFSVVLGAVLMGYYGISSWSGFPGVSTLIFHSMLAQILLLMPKLMIGQRILRHYRPGGTGRMFTPLWWTRHFIYVSLFFAAGRIVGSL
jgi:hypothetical protein